MSEENTKVNTVVIVCSTLAFHMEEAQKEAHTDYPIIEMDNKLHARPKKYWLQVFRKMEELPEEFDTVLLGMGVCGGAAMRWPLPRRVVMPRVDDCISLLMQTDDQFHYNRKEAGHFYLTEEENLMSIERMKKELCEKYGPRKAGIVMDAFFGCYKSVEMVDTGLYDSHSEHSEERLRREAGVIGVPYGHVPGSNRIFRKLLAGQWDEQFVVYEKGQFMTEEDFDERAGRRRRRQDG